MTDTEKELLNYLGIPNEEWPMCNVCNKKIAFIITDDDYDSRKINPKASIKIQCKRCRRETHEHSKASDCIYEWNKYFN